MLKNFVSNTDRDVYVLFNLPEEVVAVIFAYVSRSPDSFRTNLRKLLAEDLLQVPTDYRPAHTHASAKAAAFHEKWVLNYGHSSVAEHAVAHVGVERISRLASAELALGSSFNSFTEYSQRYQQLQAGAYHIPALLEEHPAEKKAFCALQDRTFTLYEQLSTQLLAYLEQEAPGQADESAAARRRRLSKLALEDARYALTLATHTQLGMTGNGRSLRAVLVHLLSSPYPECHTLAQNLEAEVRQTIPTLLRYVEPSSYEATSQEQIRALLRDLPAPRPACAPEGPQEPEAAFLQMPSYTEALRTLAALAWLQTHDTSYRTAREAVSRWGIPQCEALATAMLSTLQPWDPPNGALEHLNYQASFTISEANWHQLLRHNRRMHFTSGKPSIQHGWTLPPVIATANLTEQLAAGIALAEEVYAKLYALDPALAPYAVTNAHRRQVVGSCSLKELYHLINLRTAADAQWDIRASVGKLLEALQQEHPILGAYAQRRQRGPLSPAEKVFLPT